MKSAAVALSYCVVYIFAGINAVFVESSEFTNRVNEYLPDEAYNALQQRLMDNPKAGTPIRGCGGLRKLRTSDPRRGKGKRGGARVIYLYIPEVKWFFMLDIYGKDEKGDLSAKEKKELSKLTEELKRLSRSAATRTKRSKQ